MSSQALRVLCVIALANRQYDSGTELFIAADTIESEFCLSMASRNAAKPLGFLRFIRLIDRYELIQERQVPLFELVEVLSSGSLVQCPVIAWSSVLWTRAAATSEVSL